MHDKHMTPLHVMCRLANAMEERLEEANMVGPLASPHNWQDMESLVVWCRAAAALQPDGTDVPATRCEVSLLAWYQTLIMTIVICMLASEVA